MRSPSSLTRPSSRRPARAQPPARSPVSAGTMSPRGPGLAAPAAAAARADAAIDLAPSIGAAVICPMIAVMSCPASCAARSRCWRALRECSRWYRQAWDSVRLAVICWSMSGYRACRVAADHRWSRWPVPPAYSWACRIRSVADRSPASRCMTLATRIQGRPVAGFFPAGAVLPVTTWAVSAWRPGHADVQGLPGQGVGDEEVRGSTVRRRAALRHNPRAVRNRIGHRL